VQQLPETVCNDAKTPKARSAESEVFQVVSNSCSYKQLEGMGDTGLEQPSKTPTKPHVCDRRGTESGTPDARPASDTPPADPGLARLITAWPDLPPTIRAAIAAMVATAGGKGGER